MPHIHGWIIFCDATVIKFTSTAHYGALCILSYVLLRSGVWRVRQGTRRTSVLSLQYTASFDLYRNSNYFGIGPMLLPKVIYQDFRSSAVFFPRSLRTVLQKAALYKSKETQAIDVLPMDPAPTISDAIETPLLELLVLDCKDFAFDAQKYRRTTQPCAK